MCLRSCWRRTFWAHTVKKMMWGDTCDLFWETITASHVIVCCNSVNHSNIPLIIVLTAQSDTSNFPIGSASTYFRWSGQFRYNFVKGFFRHNLSNFYWNRFIFDRQGAKNKLAQFFLRHGGDISISSLAAIFIFPVVDRCRTHFSALFRALHGRKPQIWRWNALSVIVSAI